MMVCYMMIQLVPILNQQRLDMILHTMVMQLPSRNSLVHMMTNQMKVRLIPILSLLRLDMILRTIVMKVPSS